MIAIFTARVVRAPSDSSYLSLGERPRLPFTARDILTRPTPSAPRRALVPCEHSFTVNPLFLPFLIKGGLISLLLRALNDTNDPTELAHFSLKGVAWISPQLRTSNDHSFIVGVP